MTSAGGRDASSPSAIALRPDFSPDVFDYYVHCAAGTNALVVAMEASPGAESALVKPASSPRRARQTVKVDVNEGQAIVAEAVDPGATTPYWVRCLPHDFPKLRWTPHPEVGAPTPGYYLLGTQLPAPSQGDYAFILDAHGVPVWYATPKGIDASGVFGVDTLVDGSVSFFPQTTDTADGQYWFFQLATSAESRVGGAGDFIDEHELRRLPNGHYLTISAPVEPGIDLTGLEIPLLDGGTATLSGAHSILSCNIIELDGAGNVVWTWKATDHFDPLRDTTWMYGPALSANAYGVFHCNSIDVDPATGNLLVSARNMDSVFYIDKASQRVLWKMGGHRYTKEGAPFIPVADAFLRQHDARLLPGWSQTCAGSTGRLSVFDDRTTAPGTARAAIYEVTVAADDAGVACHARAPDAGAGVAPGTGTASLVWEYGGVGTAWSMGSFRILEDGSRVVGWGTGPPDAGFTEVTVDQKDLLDFSFTDGNSSYRAIKVPLAAFDLQRLRDTAGVE